MAPPITHHIRDYDSLLLGCGKRRATGYAQDRVSTGVRGVTCQKCMASVRFQAECARQEITVAAGPDGILCLGSPRPQPVPVVAHINEDPAARKPTEHWAAEGWKCTCGFDALGATQFRHKRGFDYSRELRSHFDWVKAPAERRRKDELQKQFSAIKARTDERGFTGIQFVVDHVRLSVDAFEALAAAAVRNIEEEYAIKYERH
jgi:hypothetical protein